MSPPTVREPLTDKLMDWPGGTTQRPNSLDRNGPTCGELLCRDLGPSQSFLTNNSTKTTNRRAVHVRPDGILGFFHT